MRLNSSSIDNPPPSAARSVLKPARRLPRRCLPEPIPHVEVATEGGELLEDWPHREARSRSVDAQENSSCQEMAQTGVSFSEQSSMRVYDPDPIYVRTMSYTKCDREKLASEAASEAMRIKAMVSATELSTKDSYKRLTRQGTLSLEEMVGIEHLILGTPRIRRERRNHARAVLAMQERQRRNESRVDAVEMLGRFSASRSAKSAKRARNRAALAA